MATYSLVPVDEMIFVQGQTFIRQYVVLDEDGAVVVLTGAAGRGQWRLDYRSASILATLTVTVIDPLNGIIEVILDAIDSETVSAPEFKGDIELEFPTGVVIRVVDQVFTTNYENTR